MRRIVLPLLALLIVAPLGSAQAPEPDPEAVVAAACGLDPAVRNALPLCPRTEPAAPQETPPEAPHDHGADDPAAAPGPQQAKDLAAEVVETAGEVVEDPQGAPGALAGLVATLVQFVKDLLGIPVVGLRASLDAAVSVMGAAGAAAQAAGAAVAGAGQAGLDALGAAGAAVADACGALASLVADLLAPDAAAREASLPPVGAPEGVPVAEDALGLLEKTVASAVPG